MDLSQILTKKTLNQYQKHLKQQNLPESTIKRKLSSLSKFTTFAEKHYLKKETSQINQTGSNTISYLNNTQTRARLAQEALPPRAGTAKSGPWFKRFAVALAILLAITIPLLPSDLAWFRQSPDTPITIQPATQTPTIQQAGTDNAQHPWLITFQATAETAPSQTLIATFKLYNQESDGTPLWTSSSKSITTDANGSYQITLGDTQTQDNLIPTDLFFQNANLYLETTIDNQTLDPRFRVSTATAAADSYLLQTYPPQEQATANTIPVLDSDGNLNLAAPAPKIKAENGTLSLEGQAITIQTPFASDGDITIAPDGAGTANLNFTNNSGSSVSVTNANLSQDSLVDAYLGNDNQDVNLLRLSAGSSQTDIFTVKASGQANLAGDLTTNSLTTNTLNISNLALPGGQLTGKDGAFLDIGKTDSDFLISSGGFAVNNAKTYYFDQSGNIHANNITAQTNLVVNNNLEVKGEVTLGDGGETITLNSTNIELDDFTSCTALETNASGVLVCGTDDTGDTDADTLDSLDSTQFLRSDASDAFTSGTLTINAGTQLDVMTDMRLDGQLYDENNSVGTPGQVLSTTATGVDWIDASGTIGGSGTANYITKWTDSDTLTSSVMYDDATNIGIGTTDPNYKLEVTGTGYVSSTLTVGSIASIGDNNKVLTTDSGVIKYIDTTGWDKDSSDDLDGTGVQNYTARWTDANTLATGVLYDTNTNVGVATTDPQYTLDVTGTARITSLGAGATDTVVTHATGVFQTRTIDTRVWGATLVDGSSLTSNYLTKASDSDTITNSLLYDTGTNLGLATTDPQYKLQVVGTLQATDFYSGDGTQGASATTGGATFKDGLYVSGSITAGVGGTGTATYIPKWSDSSTLTNSLIFDDGTNIGIGTTDPGKTLEVAGDIKVTGGDIEGANSINLNIGVTNPTAITSKGHVFPEATNTYDLGSSDLYWGSLYVSGSTIFYESTGDDATISFNDTSDQFEFNIGGSDTFILDGSGLTASGTITFSDYSAGVLQTNGSGVVSANLGTANYVPKWNATGLSTTSNLYDDGTNLGIGLTNPTYKLDVTGTARVSSTLTIGSIASVADNNAVLTSDSGIIKYIDSTNWDKNSSDDFSSTATTNYLPKMSGASSVANSVAYDDGTNIGIGTTAPSSLLDVAGKLETTTFQMTNGGSTGYIMQSDASGNASWVDASSTGAWTLVGSELYPDSASYNVGIGTTDPGAYKLEVAGAFLLGNDGGTGQINTSDWDIDTTGNMSGIGAINADGTITFSGLSTGTDNSVLVLNGSNQLVTDEIDSRVWGSTLVDYSSTTANYIPKMSDTDTITDSLLYDDGTNIGLGTTAPNAKLEITGNMRIESSTENILYARLSASYDTALKANGAYGVRFGTIGPTRFGLISNNTEGLAIQADNDVEIMNGNLGIATTDPQYKLDVTGTAGFSSTIYAPSIGADTDNSVVVLNSSGLLKTDEIDSRVWGSTLVDGSSLTANYLTKASDSDTIANSLLYDTGTNLGLGTTDPDAVYHVVGGDTYFAPDTGYTFDNASGSEDVYIKGNLEVDGTIYGSVSGLVDGSGTASYIPRWSDSNTLTDSILYDDATNLGIGTTDPDYKLDVQGTAGFSSTIYAPSIGADTDNSVIVLNSSGLLKTDEIDSRVWGSTLVDYSSTTSNYIPKLSDADTITDSLLYDTATNIGVGTTDPQALLDVDGKLQTSTFQMTTGGSNGYIMQSDASGNASWVDQSSTGAWTLSGSELYPDSASYNVGIGTTDPGDYKFYVEGQCVTGDTLLPILVEETHQKTAQRAGLGSETDSLESGLSPENIIPQTNDLSIKKEAWTVGELNPANLSDNPDSEPITAHANTNITRRLEYKQIKDIKGGELVYSLNETTQKLEPQPIKGLLNMGIKPVYKLTTEDGKTIRTTGNHPYLVKTKNLLEKFVKNNNSQENSNQSQRKSNNSISVKIPKIKTIHNNFLSSLNEISKQSVPNTISTVNDNISFPPLIGKKLGAINTKANQPADKLTANPDNVLNTASLSFLPENNFIKNKYSTEWTKVIYLNVGDEIAVVQGQSLSGDPANDRVGTAKPEGLSLLESSEPSIEFVRITSIEYVGEEQVWDIEVENTHNFVGNGIIAHNTYINNTLEATGSITGPTDETINGIDINSGAVSDITTLAASSTVTFSGLAAGTDNSVLVLNSSNELVTDEIDPDVWTPGTLIDGSGTANYLTKWSDSDTVTDSNIYDDGTNIGIGTTDPADRVEIADTSGLRLSTPSFDGARYMQLRHDNATARIESSLSGFTFSRTDGTHFMTIEDTPGYIGFVGVGTTDPQYKLEVVGTAGFSSTIYAPSIGADTDNSVVVLNSSGLLKTDEIDSRVWGSTLVDYSSTTSNYIPKMSDADTITDSLLYDTGTNIGLGTTAPSGSLDIEGTTSLLEITTTGTNDPTILLKSSGSEKARLLYDHSQSNLSLYVNSQHRLVINTDGNTGIGTTDPQNKLDVAGTIEATGFKLTTSPTAGYVLTADGAGTGTWQDLSSTAGPWTLVGNDLYPDSSAYNVGIGTTDPGSFKLDVQGTANFSSSITAAGLGTGTDNSVIILNTANQLTTDEIDARVWGSSLVDGSSLTAGYLTKVSDSDTISNSLAFDDGTNLGIGLTNPTYKLDVSGTGRVSSTFTIGTIASLADNNKVLTTDSGLIKYIDTTNWDKDTSDDLDGTGVQNYVARWTDANTLATGVLYDTATNVGIGTTDPQYKLQVTGTAAFSSTINAPSIGAGTDDSVVVLNGSGNLVTDEVDTRVWGSTLVDGSSLTAGYLTKVSDSNTIANSLVYDDGTNIGIGTTDPGADLTIQKNGAKLLLETASAPASYYTYLQSNYSSNNPMSLNVRGTEILGVYSNDLSIFGVAGISSRFVGIGTTAPTSQLHMFNSSSVDLDAMIESSRTDKYSQLTVKNGVSSLIIGAENNTGDYALSGSKANSAFIVQENNTDLHIGTNNSVDLTLNNSGNLGIATTDPQNKLDVAGTIQTTGFKLPTGASAGYFLTSDADGDASWADVSASAGPWTLNGSELYPDDASYNVGIGTTDPGAYKLDVQGTLNATGQVTFSGLGTGTDNSVLVVDGSNQLVTDEIDSRVWGSTLVDGSSLTAGYLTKVSDADTIANSVAYDDGTNIGIGTTNPDTNLQISNTRPTFGISNTSGGTNAKKWDLRASGTGLSLRAVNDAYSSAVNYISFNRETDSTNIESIRFYNGNGTEAVRIDGNAGNTGLGTTDPNQKLDIAGSAALTTTDSAGRKIFFSRLNSTFSNASSYITGYDEDDGYMNFGVGYDTGGFRFYTDSTTHQGGDLQMIINDSGYMGIGTATPQGPLQVELPAWTNRDTDSQHVIFSNSADNDAGIRFGFNQSTMVGSINVLNPSVAWGHLVLQDGGANVGIGHTNPSERLEITGNLKLSGTIDAATNETINGIDINAGAVSDVTTLNASSTVTFSGLSADTDNSVVILNSSNQLSTDEIDPDVWTAGTLLDGNGTANYVPYYSDTDTLADSNMYYDATNIGIGTTDPSALLDVKGRLYVDPDGFNGTAAIDLAVGDTDTGLNQISDGVLQVWTNNQPRMHVTAGGNVGIATTDPSQKLEVAGTIQMTGFKLTTSPTAGYVLQTDGDGVGTWADISSTAGPWTLNGNDL